MTRSDGALASETGEYSLSSQPAADFVFSAPRIRFIVRVE